MTTKDFTNGLTEVIKNLPNYDYNNEESTQMVYQYTTNGVVKYFTIHKQSWAEDIYLLARYSTYQFGWDTYKKRTSTISFTASEISDVIRKVKNNLRGVDTIEQVTNVKGLY